VKTPPGQKIMKAFIYTTLGHDGTGLVLEIMAVLSANFNTIFYDLFPRNTPEEDHQFVLLTGRDTLK
jgi:hypothetical protein